MSFGVLGASTLVPWKTILAPREHPGGPFWHILAPWDHPGGPWEQQDGHERVWNRIFVDFGLIWGPYFESFLGYSVALSLVSLMLLFYLCFFLLFCCCVPVPFL